MGSQHTFVYRCDYSCRLQDGTCELCRTFVVCMQGPSMILLAPRDAAGLLGHDAVQLHGGSQGITAQAVLEAVRAHYTKPMTRENMVHIMTQSAEFRRLLQVGAWLHVFLTPRKTWDAVQCIRISVDPRTQSGFLLFACHYCLGAICRISHTVWCLKTCSLTVHMQRIHGLCSVCLVK
jgi:hypothetical protein